MKKLLKILFIILLFISMGACAKEMDMPSPVVEYTSLEEINETAGVALRRLPVMGVSDEHFYVIADEVAEYDFTVSGRTYCFRGSRILNEDISGFYVDGEAAFNDLDSTMSTNFDDPDYMLGRFVVDDVQYALAVKNDGNLSYSTFQDILNEAKNVVGEAVYARVVKDLEGSYYDSFSSRANAQVSIIDGNEVSIDITWSNSAYEYEEWIIFATYEGDKLVYDEVLHTIVSSNAGEEVATPDEKYGAGYFEVVDGKLYWSGAGDELLNNCIFEKAE